MGSSAGGAGGASYTPGPRQPPADQPPGPGAPPLIRVALAVEPPVLRDVLREILASAPDLEVVDDAAAGHPAGHPDAADVLVLSTEEPENEAAPAAMLFRFPRSRVLALSADARRAFLYELRPHRTTLGELGRERLLAAVRSAAEARR
jgi:DNA-binding NarL/FixJ family response regulator